MMESRTFLDTNKWGKSMPVVTVGIDLAKNVFAVHRVDEAGKAVLIKPRVPRDQLIA
jgi:transposase